MNNRTRKDKITLIKNLLQGKCTVDEIHTFAGYVITSFKDDLIFNYKDEYPDLEFKKDNSNRKKETWIIITYNKPVIAIPHNNRNPISTNVTYIDKTLKK